LLVLAVWAGVLAWADIFFIALRDEEASQVWLVPPIVAWLVWVRRDTLQPIAPRYSLLGPALIALGWGVSLYGFFELKQALWHGGAVLCVIGAIATVGGAKLMLRLLPVLVVLGFLIPVPAMIRQQIAIPMQTWTASASQFVFELLAMPVARSGNVLTYRGQDVAVAEACNGMRMVFALLLVSYAFVFASPLRPAVRTLILLLSPFAAIFCNVLRLVPTVYLYGVSPDEWGPTFHDFSGWAMLAVAFLLLMGTIRLLQWAEVPVMQPRPRPLTPVPA
jgi:exosortase